MKRCGIFFFLFYCYLFLPEISQAQSHRIDSLKSEVSTAVIDSIPSIYNQLSDAFISFSPDSSETFSRKALNLAREQKNKKQEAISLRNLGYALSKKGEDYEAIKNYREGILVSRIAGKKDIEASIFRLYGNVFYYQAAYDSALAKYQVALTIYREIGNKKKMAGVLNNMGNVYYFISRFESEPYYLQALEIYKKLNDKEGLAKQYGNLGLIYIYKKDLKKAIEYSRKSLEYNQELKDNTGIATSYINLGYAYEQAGYYTLALENVKKSLDLREKSGDKKGVATSTMMLGEIHSRMKDYKNAIILLEKGLALAKEIDLNILALGDMETLSRAYYATGRFDDAQKLDKQIETMRDSTDEKKFSEKLSQMETKYKTKEKDDEIKLLTQEGEIQLLKLKRRSTYLWSAAGFILLLWVILGISYFAYRNKVKTNALLAIQNKEITLQKKEITDGIAYAQTIQKAILPPEKLLEQYLPDSFVIFKPKDIVSGDFYWTEKINNNVYFASVDCTGHGVAGAFMSIIGHYGLNRCVKDFKLFHPSEILDKLVEIVAEALHSENQNEVRNGMDIALCCLDPVAMQLEYAGAYNPVYVFRNKEVLEFKADHQPIGLFENRKPFTNHVIKLEKGDCIYVFSDGVIDQFGGEKGKKLGSKRIKELLLAVTDLSAGEQYIALKTGFENWQGNHEQTDDVTLIGVKV